MPFLQPAITRIASGSTTGGVVGTDLYVVDTNSDPSGGATFTAPVRVNMADGYAAIAEDPGLNTGIQVYRDQVLGGNARSYMNVVCVSGGTNLSYGGIAHENDGTPAGLFTQFYGTDASFNVVGAVTVSKAPNGNAGGIFMVGGALQEYYIQADDSAITMGNCNTLTPNVRVTGQSGTGQVYDTLYNNPNLPTYQSPLGSGTQVNVTPAGGAYTPVVPAFAVGALDYYRVSVAGSITAAIGGAGLMAMIIKFNNTADAIYLQSSAATTDGVAFATTIEFRVPAGNTEMTIGLLGYNGFGLTDTVTGGWGSLSIVQLT